MPQNEVGARKSGHATGMKWVPENQAMPQNEVGARKSGHATGMKWVPENQAA
jgi:hypothetical protein